MADVTNYLDDLPEERFRLSVGTYVSAAGHAGLVVWLFAGWGLTQEPIPFETIDVSVVSSEDFAEIVRRGEPEAVSEPAALATPEVEAPPEVTAEEPVATPTPEVRPEVPVDEVTPEPLQPVAPPEDVQLDAPVLEAPAPPTAPDLPITQDTPQAEEAPRVAPEAAPAPPLDADVAPVVQQEVAESPEPAEIVEDPAEAAAPEEATTDLVTEADIASGAVETSLRPPSRPAALVPAEPEPETEPEATPEPEEEPAPAPEDSTVNDLLTELTEDPVSQDPPADPGPIMTQGQQADFGRSIEGCWIRDVGSEADRVSVTVAFSLDRERRVVGNQVRLIANTEGSATAVQVAFEKARRAVLNCQRRNGGFTLNVEQYEQWRNVELTFNPLAGTVR